MAMLVVYAPLPLEGPSFKAPTDAVFAGRFSSGSSAASMPAVMNADRQKTTRHALAIFIAGMSKERSREAKSLPCVAPGPDSARRCGCSGPNAVGSRCTFSDGRARESEKQTRDEEARYTREV